MRRRVQVPQARWGIRRRSDWCYFACLFSTLPPPPGAGVVVCAVDVAVLSRVSSELALTMTRGSGITSARSLLIEEIRHGD